VVSAHDVARELRRRLPDVGQVKLHKLLYYCQAWHLIWAGQPLFSEAIEAWANGPMVASLWHTEHEDRAEPARQPLTDSHIAVVDYVVGRYGRHSGRALVRLSHTEDPWRDVSESEETLSGPNGEITNAALHAYFSRDDEYVSHINEVDRLRKRRDLYGFEGEPITPTIRAAARQVLDHEAS
jgi:uncharacterized phage-associated protein